MLTTLRFCRALVIPLIGLVAAGMVSAPTAVQAQGQGPIKLRLTKELGGSRRFSPDFAMFTRERRALMVFKKVQQSDLDDVSARIWANKKPFPPYDEGIDKPRSGRFRNNQVITINRRSNTLGEVGNYVGELEFRNGGVEAFFRRNPSAELWIYLLN